MRGILFAGAFLTMLLVGAAARAGVIYDFHETAATGFLGTLPPSAYAPRLIVSDTAPLSGVSFTRTCALTMPVSCTTTGHADGFLSLTDATPDFGTLSLDLAFNPDNTLNGSILERGLDEDLNMAGSGLDWSGTLLSDRFPACGVSAPCTITGYWLTATAVSEPGTLALFVGGLATLLFVGRRSRA